MARLWRYMSVNRFEDMMRNGGLFLARADMFSDKLEGTLSRANLEKRQRVYRENPLMANAYARLVSSLYDIRRWTYVSCWRVDEEESPRAWKEYAKFPEGVAIQTDYLRLSRLTGCMFCACVEYVDYKRTWIVENNSMMPFIHKDKTCDWEKEFRIIIQRFPQVRRGDKTVYDCSEENPHCGLVLGADLSAIIEKIVISPAISVEGEAAIRNLVKHYGLKSRVEKSAR